MSLTQLFNDQRDFNIDEIKASKFTEVEACKIAEHYLRLLVGGSLQGRVWKAPLAPVKPANPEKQLARAACLHFRASLLDSA